jgi:hypothetical protein
LLCRDFGATLGIHVLARYQIVRGKRAPGDPLPDGRRIDTRKHTQHCLRPEAEQVEGLFGDMSAAGFARFAEAYRATLEARFARDRAAFDLLAQHAQREDVYLGCSCPTQRNPDVNRCHTVLALRFMREHYPKLKVVFPNE